MSISFAMVYAPCVFIVYIYMAQQVMIYDFVCGILSRWLLTLTRQACKTTRHQYPLLLKIPINYNNETWKTSAKTP